MRMRTKKPIFCTKSIMLLLGTIVLLMIAGFVVPIHAQPADISAKTGLESNVLSVFDPFLLQTVTFTPRLASASASTSVRDARPPRASGNTVVTSEVLVPGRREVRTEWLPGDGPPPKIF